MLDRFVHAPGDVAGVLVGHTHFDHAVDAPAIARRFGCKAYGSDSLLTLMGLHGLAEQTVEVEPYRTYELGPFGVSFTPSVHSKLLLGLAVPYDGDLTCEHLDALSPSAYRCGQVWGISIEVAGITLYHQGSANLIDEAIRERDVDVFLAGIAGRSSPRTTGSGSSPASTPRSWSPPITTTSSARSAARWSSSPTSSSRRFQTRSAPSVPTPDSRHSPARISRQTRDIPRSSHLQFPRLGAKYLAAICSTVPMVLIVVGPRAVPIAFRSRSDSDSPPCGSQ